MIFKLKLAVALSLFGLLSAGSAQGAILFSVYDAGLNDQLVTIDSSTGVVRVIGSIGVDVNARPELAFLGDRLFLLSTDTASRVDLLELNPTNGAMISTTRVSVDGIFPATGEGLTSVGDKLVLSYRRTGSGIANSNTIGELSLAGIISDSVNFALESDLDGLATDSSGQIYAVDQFTPTLSQTRLQLVSLSPATLTNLSTVGSPGVNDIAFTATGRLFGIDGRRPQDVHKIREFDPVTGAQIAAVDYDPSMELFGLAYSPAYSVVPEPSALAVWSLVFACLAAIGYRRNRKHL